MKLPSRNSRDFGRSFADIFKAVDYDFYKIDGALFAPAEVWVSNLDSGRSFHAGALEMDLLRRPVARIGQRIARLRLPMRVAIFADETGWHTRQLQAALRARGALGRCVDLEDCRIDTSGAWHGLVIPGLRPRTARRRAGARHRRRQLSSR